MSLVARINLFIRYAIKLKFCLNNMLHTATWLHFLKGYAGGWRATASI